MNQNTTATPNGNPAQDGMDAGRADNRIARRQELADAGNRAAGLEIERDRRATMTQDQRDREDDLADETRAAQHPATNAGGDACGNTAADRRRIRTTARIKRAQRNSTDAPATRSTCTGCGTKIPQRASRYLALCGRCVGASR